MKLTVVGCGDAFGSGGRLQTCYHVDTGSGCFLIDCGATTLIGFNRLGLDFNAVETILISHLHGDHFAGVAWWLLHAQLVSKRTTPLTIAGPVGIEARFTAMAEALFPGSTAVTRRFPLSFREYSAQQPITIGPLVATAFEVRHPSGAPPYALRIETAGRVLAFTGDTEWVDALIPAGRDADLYIMECYGFDGDTRYHMNWRAIEQHLPAIGARRVLLTHMNAEMLRRAAEVTTPGVQIAHDGLVLDL